MTCAHSQANALELRSKHSSRLPRPHRRVAVSVGSWLGTSCSLPQESGPEEPSKDLGFGVSILRRRLFWSSGRFSCCMPDLLRPALLLLPSGVPDEPPPRASPAELGEEEPGRQLGMGSPERRGLEHGIGVSGCPTLSSALWDPLLSASCPA